MPGSGRMGDPQALAGGITHVRLLDLLNLRERGGQVRFIEGAHQGEVVDFKVVADGERWLCKMRGMQSLHLQPLADGRVLIPREDDLEEQVKVFYDPPLVLPATLRTGSPVTGQSQMVVRRLADDSIREEGTCDYTLELAGQQLIEGLGPEPVIVLRQTRKMALKLATVEVTLLSGYRPGAGAVASRLDQTVWPLGLFPLTTRWEWQRNPDLK